MIKLKTNNKIKVDYSIYPCYKCRKRENCIMACYALDFYCKRSIKGRGKK